MAKLPRSLSRSVSWHSVLELLGLPLNNYALPAHTTCPLCENGILDIWPDHRLGGEWFRCRSCCESGDMIQLVAAARKSDIAAAIEYLSARGVGISSDRPTIDVYEREHLGYRRHVRELWEPADGGRVQEPLGRSKELASAYGLHCDVDNDRWRDGPGQLVRGFDITTVERCFAPGSMSHAAEKRQRTSPSQHATFKGPGWRHVLAVPYYDLPGRIGAFAFVGRRRKGDENKVFRCVNGESGGNQHSRAVREAGLAMHPDVLPASDRWNRVIVGLWEPWLMLRLQFRHLDMHLSPLPLVAWHDSLMFPDWHSDKARVWTSNAWQQVCGRKIVLWMPAFHVLTVRQAIETNALIATNGPRDDSPQALKEYIWKYTPEELVHALVRAAKPWPQVLSDHINRSESADIESLLFRLDQDGVNFSNSLNKLCPGAMRKAKRAWPPKNAARMVVVNGKTIVERDGKWYLRRGHNSRSDELIINAILRITAVIHCQKNPQSYLKGYVLYKGRKLRFLARESELKRNAMNWVRQRVMDAGVGYPIGDYRSRLPLLHIAQMFFEPKFIRGVERIGWDGDKQRFVFPTFGLKIGGEVVSVTAPSLLESAPAIECVKPEETVGQLYGLPLEDSPETSVFWAVASAVISNLLARAYHLPIHGIALCGKGARHIGEAVAEALGCAVMPLNRAADVRRLLDQQLDAQHDWPLVLQIDPRLQRGQQRRLFVEVGDRPRNCIVALDEISCHLLAVHGGWRIIRCDHVGTIEQDALTAAKKLVPTYLQDLMRRNLCVVSSVSQRRLPHLAGVIDDLATFVDERLANSTVRRATDVLPDEDNQAGAIVELLRHLVEAGRLRLGDILPTDLSPAAGEVLLRTVDIERAVRGSVVPLPEHDEISHLLESAGILIESRHDGWVIDGRRLRPRAGERGTHPRRPAIG